MAADAYIILFVPFSRIHPFALINLNGLRIREKKKFLGKGRVIYITK